jgi:hypothetical protein
MTDLANNLKYQMTFKSTKWHIPNDKFKSPKCQIQKKRPKMTY